MTTKTKRKPAAKPVECPPEAKRLLCPAQITKLLGCSERQFRTLVSTGQYPPADARCGAYKRWKLSTHNAYIDGLAPPED